MAYRSYYDPHYKPSRTFEKYKADQNKYRVSVAENSEFVAEFLVHWTKREAREDPAEAFKALRIEARRLAGLKSKRPLLRTIGPVRVKRGKQPKKAMPVPKLPPRETFPKARFELDSSQKYLPLSNEALLGEYSATQEKIERWCEQYDGEINPKKREQLASQIQIQYGKRRDLIALIGHRLQE